LRDKNLRGWVYSKHYVDSAIKQAYSMLESWRKRYLHGRAKRRPELKRKFVRVKETLYSYRDGILRISVKPYEESITIDLRRTWCWDKINGLEFGELILKQDKLIVTVRKEVELKIKDPIAWDTNLFTLDGFDSEKHYSISLKKVYTIHRIYELKRRVVQKLPEKTRKRLLKKYSLRERNRVNDALHKLTKRLSDRTNVFEDLRNFKERIARTKSRSMNRQNSKHDYIKLQKYVDYKSAWNGYATIFVKAYGTSKTCSRCGYYNKDLRGEVFECPKCGLVIDRQKNAAKNIWKKFLSMWGVMGSPRKEQSSMSPPMNPEEEKSVEAQGLSMDSILSSEPYKLLEDANLYSLTLCLSDSSKHKPKHIIKLLAIRPRTVKF
ncbi:MAG: transposase, partial [Candidatus Brockarchaeota archaeon]|nr:transposase [Candidatus Brockarchaeota archaeon]